MTLDEAIKHCEDKAKELRGLPFKEEMEIEDIADCEECAEEQEQLASWLIELKAWREDNRWIPVSERLPEKNMACLVSVGNFHLTQIAMYSDLMETIDHKIFYQGDYGHENFMNITEYVKAWQPLPKPYESEDKND